MANFHRRIAVVVGVTACFPAVALANAARVDFAVGNVTATGPDGRSRALTRGAEISQGDTVNTQNGRAQLRFSDGAYMSLQPQTEFKIEEFRFDGKEDGKENIVMNLLKGGMRTITGLIGRSNRSNYKLKTDVATIGIRGTEYSVQYTNSIEVFCAGGSINLENQGGSLTISGGQGATVQTQQTAPQQTSQPPVLSPTSTTQQKQEEEQQQAGNEPNNPVQESSSAGSVSSQIATASASTLLTGTFTGNWAAAMSPTGARADVGQEVSLDSSGRLISFNGGASAGSGTATAGTSTAVFAGSDGILGWGRWIGGVIGGNNTIFAGKSTALDPMHYVVGVAATNIPTLGMGTYTLVGSSASCYSGGCTGVSLPAHAATTPNQLMVNFQTLAVSLALTFNLTGGTYQGTYSGQGTIGALNSSTGRISGTNQISVAPVVGGSAGGTLNSSQGFVAGPGASHAGLSWTVLLADGPLISGASAYKK